ncbi:serine/threonine-protein kinase [Nocardiopsis composta]
MATEYVPGPTLKEAVRDHGPLPAQSLPVLASGLARALAAIHGADLVHRDLKPGNVLLSPRGPQVIDFGIARAVEGTVLTRTGQTLGTPAYTSPEQVTGSGVSPVGDVFSLAGTVLFAAGGRPRSEPATPSPSCTASSPKTRTTPPSPKAPCATCSPAAWTRTPPSGRTPPRSSPPWPTPPPRTAAGCPPPSARRCTAESTNPARHPRAPPGGGGPP